MHHRSPTYIATRGNKIVYGNATQPCHIVKDIAGDGLSEAKAMLQSNQDISFSIVQDRHSNSKQEEDLKEIVNM